VSRQRVGKGNHGRVQLVMFFRAPQGGDEAATSVASQVYAKWGGGSAQREGVRAVRRQPRAKYVKRVMSRARQARPANARAHSAERRSGMVIEFSMAGMKVNIVCRDAVRCRRAAAFSVACFSVVCAP